MAMVMVMAGREGRHTLEAGTHQRLSRWVAGAPQPLATQGPLGASAVVQPQFVLASNTP